MEKILWMQKTLCLINEWNEWFEYYSLHHAKNFYFYIENNYIGGVPTAYEVYFHCDGDKTMFYKTESKRQALHVLALCNTKLYVFMKYNGGEDDMFMSISAKDCLKGLEKENEKK